jgi:hypothetical protein
MIYQNPDGTLLIYDWKRCKEIVKENAYGSCATTECIRHLADTNFWHYALQLNTYKTIIEEKYGKKVVGLCLVCLHPNNPDYQLIEVPFLEKEMVDLFEYRKEMLSSAKKTYASSKVAVSKVASSKVASSKVASSKVASPKVASPKVASHKPLSKGSGLLLNLNNI